MLIDYSGNRKFEFVKKDATNDCESIWQAQLQRYILSGVLNDAGMARIGRQGIKKYVFISLVAIPHSLEIIKSLLT